MAVKPVTMADVAREAGVSRALVSMAFRGVPGVNEQTRVRILETADRLGYRFNWVASRLASRATSTLGVYLLDLRQDVYADMFDGVREVAERHEKYLVLAVGAGDGRRDERALDSLAQSRVDIVIATGLLLPDEQVRAYARSVPLVSVARMVDGVDSVHSDNLLGARLATQHLVELGHRRILFLSNPQTDGYLDRQRGYVAVMEHAGAEPWIVPSHYSRQQAAVDISPALDVSPARRPTAIFAHNDQAALGVLDAMAVRGLRTPDDISLIGYDNTELSRTPVTALTTVDIRGHELGREAALVALSRLANPEGPPMVRSSDPELIVRATTGAPRRS